MNKFNLIIVVSVALGAAGGGYSIAKWQERSAANQLLVIDRGATVVELISALKVLNAGGRDQLEKIYADRTYRSLQIYQSLVGKNCNDNVNDSVIDYISGLDDSDPRVEYWSGVNTMLGDCFESKSKK